MNAMRAKRRDRGFVLVSVLWILAILTVISLGFARRSMIERRMAWYALDREQAQQMARAAAERGLFELRHKMVLDSFNNQAGYTGLDQRWAHSIDLFGEAPYFETTGGPAFRDDVCEVRIEDAERRISINDVPREMLEGLKALNFKTIDEVMERRSTSTRAYQTALFHSVEELRAIERIPDRIWYGDGQGAGLRDVLTVWGDRATKGMLNVNTASASVLSRIPDMEPAVVEQIMTYRNGPDGQPYTQDDRAFASLQAIAQKTNVSAEKLAPIYSHCKTDSRYFTITAHASRRRGKINAYCTVVVQLQGAQPVILEWREDTVGA